MTTEGNSKKGGSQTEVLFNSGRVFITPGADSSLPGTEVLEALRRHMCGDWGNLCELDRRENELGLKEGYRLLSAYRAENGVKFWIITEWDRSCTTVLLPEEY